MWSFSVILLCDSAYTLLCFLLPLLLPPPLPPLLFLCSELTVRNWWDIKISELISAFYSSASCTCCCFHLLLVMMMTFDWKPQTNFLLSTLLARLMIFDWQPKLTFSLSMFA